MTTVERFPAKLSAETCANFHHLDWLRVIASFDLPPRRAQASVWHEGGALTPDV